MNYNEKFKGKQMLERYQDGHASGRQAGRAFDPNDVARNTMKQTTMNLDRATYVSGHKAHRTELQDPVRRTINEGLVGLERSTFVGGHNANKSALQDKARNTIKQYTVQESRIGNAGINTNQGYINDNLDAPITFKQLTHYNDHIGNAGSSAINTNNPVDSNIFYAPTTLKQLHNGEYIGNAGNSYQATNQNQYYNASLNANRENVMTSRVPTTANVNIIPTSQCMGEIIMPNESLIDYSYVNIPKQRGHDYNPDLNMTLRNMPNYGDQLNNYNMNGVSAYSVPMQTDYDYNLQNMNNY